MIHKTVSKKKFLTDNIFLCDVHGEVENPYPIWEWNNPDRSQGDQAYCPVCYERFRKTQTHVPRKGKR